MDVTNRDTNRVAQDVTLRVDGNGVDLAQLPDGCSEQLNSEIICRTGALLPQDKRTWTFALAPMGSGSGITVMAEVAPTGATDVFTADNSAQLDIRLGEDGATLIAVDSHDAGDEMLALNSSQYQSQTEASPSSSAAQSAGASSYLLLAAIFLPTRRRWFLGS